ncbi:MAG TPA: AMP-binding protein [Oscillospiraceae bacterium]|nr:AMP-binding protein [Oscillospiraceae bacterium]HPF55424.1 AMP-binding protein [Clostridiales bacterium]HPK34460.1 AMP-binding protein [Oscillospiraceae bacterium]HPR76286.1 AMP-binding protein [Oscillospiraceae bacterium]
MKYYNRALSDLEKSDLTFRAIFEVVFSFGGNVFLEYQKDGEIAKITYAQCKAYIEDAAGVLFAALGEQKRSRFVGIKLENSPEWIVAFWALLMAGYRPLLVNTRAPQDDIGAVLKSADAAAVISDAPFGEYPFIDANQLIRKPEKPIEPAWADEIALCSSGTTGTMKLCLYRGRAISEQIFNSRYVLKANPTIESYYKGEAKLLAFLPFYHIFGLVANLLWFSFFGRTFVFSSGYTHEAIRDACRRHGVTHIFAIPVLWNTVAAGIEKEIADRGEKLAAKFEKGVGFSLWLQSVFPQFGRKLVSASIFKEVLERVFGPSVRFCISGGGYIYENTLRLINAIGYPLYNGYGMTEIGITSVQLALPAEKRLSGSVGKPFPSVTYEIAGGDSGELIVRGNSLAHAIIENGVLHERKPEEPFYTGDLVHRGDKGDYWIDGRKDDLIICENGENLSPDAIECHFRIERVKHLCVLGVKGAKNTVCPALIVRPEDNATPYQIDGVLSQVFQINSALPMNMQVRRVLLAEKDLPTVLECKVQRRAVAKMLENGETGFREVKLSEMAVLEGKHGGYYIKTLGRVCELFTEVLSAEEPVKPEAHFLYDLSGNSLQYFSLVEKICAEFNVTISLGASEFFATPAEFAGFIMKN